MATIVPVPEQNANSEPQWIKSTLSVQVQPVTDEEEGERNQPYKQEARREFEKIAKTWPEGELSAGAYGDATIEGALHIQYYYQPAEAGPFGIIEIDLYIGVDPDKTFEEMKEECLQAKPWREEDKAVDGFVNWPAGFPDQNDYEQVSHCGATKDLSKVFWTQNKTFVQLSSMKGGDVLTEYADGVWQVVYGMGL